MEVTESKRQLNKENSQKTFSCVLNPVANSGEQMVLEVDVFDDGDFQNVSIGGCCYGNHSFKVNLNISVEVLLKACEAIVAHKNEKINSI